MERRHSYIQNRIVAVDKPDLSIDSCTALSAADPAMQCWFSNLGHVLAGRCMCTLARMWRQSNQEIWSSKPASHNSWITQPTSEGCYQHKRAAVETICSDKWWLGRACQVLDMVAERNIATSRRGLRGHAHSLYELLVPFACHCASRTLYPCVGSEREFLIKQLEPQGYHWVAT